MKVQKLVALLIMVIPGVLGVYGWKLMRDALFYTFDPESGFQWFAFIGGLFLFLFGIIFIGSFIFYRDRKRRRVQRRFRDDLDD